MRLSEAINLGSTTVKMEPANISCCALGAACNAVGISDDADRYSAMRARWPWLNSGGYVTADGYSCRAATAIYTRFDENVCGGEMTLEQLIDYVRSIEPDEPTTEVETTYQEENACLSI